MAGQEEGIDGLASLRQRGRKKAASGAESRAAVDPPRKQCAFLCGHSNLSDDEDNGGKRIRWAYPDGSGCACWLCDRVWSGHYSHKWKDRRSLQVKMGKNVNLLEEFHGFRTAFIQRRKHGKAYLSTRAAGVKNTALHTKVTYRVKLITHDDDFWEYSDYVKKFGDPKSAENKKNRHVVTKVNGIRGVIVPSGNAGGPMKVRREVLDDIAKTDTHHDSDDEDGIGAEVPLKSLSVWESPDVMGSFRQLGAVVGRQCHWQAG